MFLKYLEIQGFKSFPDKVKIEFNKGITGIVGPNGSGKSNISDAIRWVMGEQSIKSLRGGKMEDVIFSGTEQRKPLSFSEVSICFYYSDNLFNVEYNEVVITRRYFRSGESEYYINKASCRLKDVHELLMDTGMGKDGYSIVGQGRIDEMITAKPEDRRAIFEEASGISKYKYRKTESERKIQQTEDNLIRILDLLSEIESRLEPLKNDSEKAKKYLELKEELKDHEINLSVNMLEKIKESLKKFNNDLFTVTENITTVNEKIKENEDETNKLSVLAMEKENCQEQLSHAFFDISKKISDCENKINIYLNNLKNNDLNTSRIFSEIKETEENINKVTGEKEQFGKRIASLDEIIDALNKELEKLKVKYNEADNKAQESNSRIEECNSKIVDLYRALSEKNAETASAKKEYETVMLRKKSIADDIDFVIEDIEDYKHKKEAEEEKAKELGKKTADIKSKLEGSQKAKLSKEQKIENAKNELNRISAELDKDISKKKMLEDMEKEMEGYSYSVKAVINESKNGELKNLGVLGTVSKNIGVEEKYALAIDAVLGNVLQNIITQTEEDAKKAIEYLKRVKGGRATFLPIESVKGKLLDTREFKGEKGYISLASEVVECAAKFKGVIDEILGRTVLIDNIDNAIKFAGKFKYKYKIVTLTGEVIAAGGAITGGNLGKGGSFLSRTQAIKSLSNSILNNEKEFKRLSELLEKEKKEFEEENIKCEKLSEELQLAENEIFKIKYNVENYNLSYEKAKDELNEYIKEKEGLEKRRIESEKLEKNLNGDKENINKEIALLQDEIKNIQQSGNETLSESKQINTDIMKLNAEISENESEKFLLIHQIEDIDALVEKYKADIQKRKADIGLTSEAGVNINAEIDALKKEIEEYNRQSEETNLKIEDVKAQRTEIQEKTAELGKKTKECNEQLIILSKEQAKVEAKISSYENQFETINSKLWEEYELTYADALAYKKEVENLSELKKYVDKIRAQIRNLGNVNVNAIEEYKETKERYDFLTTQKEDLTKAKETLNNVIKDMESLMTKQFLERLGVINETFAKTFKELFGGGHAELVLTDEANVLTSGIEIIAQPPGKKLQNMTLFSGGEKAIIAISLLFALLDVRPSPLCVLDEIEAALDDVNVNRFAQYLRRISKMSQIAIITHRRGTMEEADVLYGVTMQEKGVSKLLSLNITEIEEKILKNQEN